MRELFCDIDTGPQGSPALILTDSPTRMQLGRLGRQKVLQMFTAEAMAKRTLAVYEQYLSKKGTVATVRKMPHLFR